MDIAVRFSTRHVSVLLYDIVESRFHIIRHLFGISWKKKMYNSMILKIVPQVHVHLLFKLRRCDIFKPKCFNWYWGFFLNLEALNNENFKFVLLVIVSIAKAWTLGLTRQWRTRLSPPLGVSTVKLPFQTSHDGHTPFLPETIFTNFILLTRYQQKQTLKNIDRILSNTINKSYFFLVLNS